MSSRSELNPKHNALDKLKERAAEVTAVGVIGLMAVGCTSPGNTTAAEHRPQPVSTSLAERPLDSSAESIELTEEELRGLEVQSIGYFNERTSEVINDPSLSSRPTPNGALEFHDENGHSVTWFATEELRDGTEILLTGFANRDQVFPKTPATYRTEFHGIAFTSKESGMSPDDQVTPELVSKVVNSSDVEIFGIFYDKKEDGQEFPDRTTLSIKDGKISGVNNQGNIIGTDNIRDAVEESRGYFVTKDNPAN